MKIQVKEKNYFLQKYEERIKIQVKEKNYFFLFGSAELDKKYSILWCDEDYNISRQYAQNYTQLKSN